MKKPYFTAILQNMSLVKKLDADPGVDYIGLDYIRTGSAEGFELADLFVKDMNVDTPSEWSKKTKQERIIWIARNVMIGSDTVLVEKWQWWRAHLTALNVKEIIEKSGIKKPLWLFTLGWDHGKQHGQDPLMFNDAGIGYDAVMLYEANNIQFRQVLIDWKAYLQPGKVNTLCGNSVDIDLLDSQMLTPPEEMLRRTVMGSEQLLFGGMTDGIFWHDLTRAFWGRKGEYSTKEWAIVGGTCFSRYREDSGLSPISMRIYSADSMKASISFKVDVRLINLTTKPVSDINVWLENVDGLVTDGKVTVVTQLLPGERMDVTFVAKLRPVGGRIRNNIMVPAIAEWTGGKRVFYFKIMKIK